MKKKNNIDHSKMNLVAATKIYINNVFGYFNCHTLNIKFFFTEKEKHTFLGNKLFYDGPLDYESIFPSTFL